MGPWKSERNSYGSLVCCVACGPEKGSWAYAMLAVSLSRVGKHRERIPVETHAIPSPWLPQAFGHAVPHSPMSLDGVSPFTRTCFTVCYCVSATAPLLSSIFAHRASPVCHRPVVLSFPSCSATCHVCRRTDPRGRQCRVPTALGRGGGGGTRGRKGTVRDFPRVVLAQFRRA